MEWFSFIAADEHLGIETQYIYRVVDDVKITPVPLTPSCYMGLLYYRGELFDVVHLGNLLKQEKAKRKDGEWIILLKWSGKKLGFFPDRVRGLVWVEDQEGSQRIHIEEKETIRLITPDLIWNKLLEFSYGYSKIPENIQPGI
ncbi:MAG: chemotaxis protein CheW [Pseudomonadota bacterium]